MTYIFPLSPTDIQKSVPTPNAIYDTQGTSGQNGIAREADVNGQSLPVYTIRGTTGWKYHLTDAYQWTGMDSITQLENILTQYAQLNQQQQEAGSSDLYTLEFYDYFRQEFWQVVPIGQQGIRQTADAPLFAYYSLTLAATQAVSAAIPPSAPDSFDQLLGLGSTPAIQASVSFSLSIGTLYG
jgi:hypothetical protein